MKINEVVNPTLTGTITKFNPPTGGNTTPTVTIKPTGGTTIGSNSSTGDVTVPVPPGAASHEPNGSVTLVAQNPKELHPGEKINVVNPTTQVTEEDDEYEEKSDHELISLAKQNPNIEDDSIRIIDNKLANREELISLLRGDIGGIGDQTYSLISQVEDPFYGTLSEMKRFAGL